MTTDTTTDDSTEENDHPKAAGEPWPESGPHSPNVGHSDGEGPMGHDCYITHHDRERLTELHKKIRAFDEAYVYTANHDIGELKVRLNLDDEWSKAARKDYYQNRIDRRLEELADRLEAMSWEHFDAEEMASILRARELLLDVADNMTLHTRLAPPRNENNETGGD